MLVVREEMSHRPSQALGLGRRGVESRNGATDGMQMATVRHLRNAPIVEAAVSIQVDLPAETTLDAAWSAHDRIREQYPLHGKQMSGTFQVQFVSSGEPAPATSSSEHIGYRFMSTDQRRVADFAKSAFTLHWLPPYTEWTDLRSEATRLWEIYKVCMKPKAVTRIDVRFINNLSIPATAKDICDFLVPGPIVPEGLPQAVRSYVSRIEIVDEPGQRLGVITQAFQGITKEGHLSVLLDIDAIYLGSLAPDDAEIWDAADKMRDFKNEMFFRSVTDQLLERYT